MKRYQKMHSTSSRWFDVMLMLLTCVAASTDVISYFRLGNVFTANMTGNAILLGLSIGKGELSTSLMRLSSLLGFIIGVFAGAIIVINKKKEWPYNVKLVIGIESVIIGALAVIWLFHSIPLKNGILYIAILLSAISMGMQSAAVWHLGIPGIVTTFLTGNITSIGLNTVNGWRFGFKKRIKNEIPDNPPVPKNLEDRVELQAMVFFIYIISAIFTGWVQFHEPEFLPLLPLFLILCVMAILIKYMKNQSGILN